MTDQESVTFNISISSISIMHVITPSLIFFNESFLGLT